MLVCVCGEHSPMTVYYQFLHILAVLRNSLNSGSMVILFFCSCYLLLGCIGEDMKLHNLCCAKMKMIGLKDCAWI